MVFLFENIDICPPCLGGLLFGEGHYAEKRKIYENRNTVRIDKGRRLSDGSSPGTGLHTADDSELYTVILNWRQINENLFTFN